MEGVRAQLKQLAQYLKEAPIYTSIVRGGGYTPGKLLTPEERKKLAEEVERFAEGDLERITISIHEKIKIGQYEIGQLSFTRYLEAPFAYSRLIGELYVIGEKGYVVLRERRGEIRPANTPYIGEILAVVQPKEKEIVIVKEKEEIPEPQQKRQELRLDL